jgi:hypothetical protein
MGRLIVRCLCGSAGPFREFAAPLTGLPVAGCQHCGTLHQITTETRAAIEEQYEGAYHANAERHPGCVPYRDRYAHDLHVAQVRWAHYRSILDGQLEVPHFRALDVGAANGAFVDYLRRLELPALGVDPDPTMTRDAVQHGTIDDVDGEFSLLTYHDVLEHLVDPLAELERARARLCSRGVIVVDVPDVFAPAGVGDHHFKREHLWFFTDEALHELLRRSGFRPWVVDRPVPGKIVAYGIAS